MHSVWSATLQFALHGHNLTDINPERPDSVKNIADDKASAGDRIYLDVPSGIYIVKAGNTTKRVAVKH